MGEICHQLMPDITFVLAVKFWSSLHRLYSYISLSTWTPHIPILNWTDKQAHPGHSRGQVETQPLAWAMELPGAPVAWEALGCPTNCGPHQSLTGLSHLLHHPAPPLSQPSTRETFSFFFISWWWKTNLVVFHTFRILENILLAKSWLLWDPILKG